MKLPPDLEPQANLPITAPLPSVLQWLERHDAELALNTVVIAELAFGIEEIQPDQRARRLSAGLNVAPTMPPWRHATGAISRSQTRVIDPWSA